jgi:anti-sigma factor RsiW
VTSFGHQDAKDRFDRYYEGDLPAEEQRAMDGHLASCSECREEYQRLVEALGALSRLRDAHAPQGFLDAVQGRIRKRSHGRFFARRPDFTSRLPYEVLSVVMLIAILAIFLYIFLGKGGGAIAR